MADDLQSWVGRKSAQADEMDPWSARALHMTLDRSDPLPETGSPLPPAWHWVYFKVAAPLSDLGRDGHPSKGSFLPPVTLPRRMWAGGRFTIDRPLILGTPAERTSTILSITAKEGRSGPLCFVTVEHKFIQDNEHCFTEEHDIVYLEDRAPGHRPPPPATTGQTGDWEKSHTPTPTQLFRYSALTFNGHRIHYDRDYARDIEGYPGLVVHGPLIATLMFDLLQDHVSSSPVSIIYQAKAPLFDQEDLTVRGRRENGSISLSAHGPARRLLMTATVTV